VTVCVQERNDEVEIAVIDTGVGISDEHLRNLFRIDVHHATTGTAAERGSGLGLILCKEFVDRHGGTILVESEQGKGSRFLVTLPKQMMSDA
jgi:two-component system sensor histidine kinase/response regulator